MRNLLRVKVALSAFSVFSIVAYAQNESSPNYRIEGSHSVSIQINPNQTGSNSLDIENLTGIKSIKLMNLIPSKEMIEKKENAIAEMIAAGGELNYSNGITPFKNSATSVDLGMANVPVLDQGAHGTCVTFASTAALDARLNKGNFINQQCSLALNKYLGNDYWDGAYDATQILAPLKKYGIIPNGSCFGSYYPNTSQSVSPSVYTTKSNKSYANSIKYTYVANTKLNLVKAALKSGFRVAIGTALADTADPISVNGFDMKINGKKTFGGLWACQQPSNSSNYCAVQNAGHEVVVIGYDDTQQLLKIRNSWGQGPGDKGDYYMTYYFFNAMAMDHTVVE